MALCLFYHDLVVTVLLNLIIKINIYSSNMQKGISIIPTKLSEPTSPGLGHSSSAHAATLKGKINTLEVSYLV